MVLAFVGRRQDRWCSPLLGGLLLVVACRPGLIGGGPLGGNVPSEGSGGDGLAAGSGGDGTGGDGGDGTGGPGSGGADTGSPGTGGSPSVDLGTAPDFGPPADAGALIERIGFGSCIELRKTQAFWTRVIDRRPQLFLFLGDIPYLDYGDTYAQLGALPGFQQLLTIARPLAIWDDHDYGLDDGGAAFAGKAVSKRRFVEFWGPLGAIPAETARRTRDGNYDAIVMGPVGQQVQIIMLDVRYFKGTPPAGTLLGAAQWQWLADELRRPASLRIIMSGTAVVASGVSASNEGWAQYPQEQQRLYDLIKQTEAKGVLLVSGDRHYAEISRRDVGLGYPLFDFTSSAMNAANSYAPQANLHRDSPTAASQLHNFGFITIDWNSADRPLTVQLVNAVSGAVLMTKDLTLSSLGVPP